MAEKTAIHFYGDDVLAEIKALQVAFDNGAKQTFTGNQLKWNLKIPADLTLNGKAPKGEVPQVFVEKVAALVSTPPEKDTFKTAFAELTPWLATLKPTDSLAVTFYAYNQEAHQESLTVAQINAKPGTVPVVKIVSTPAPYAEAKKARGGKKAAQGFVPQFG